MKVPLSLCQMSSSESYIDNIQKAEGYIKEAKDAGSEFILFPELFTTGLHWDVFDRYKAVCNEVEDFRTPFVLGDQ